MYPTIRQIMYNRYFRPTRHATLILAKHHQKQPDSCPLLLPPTAPTNLHSGRGGPRLQTPLLSPCCASQAMLGIMSFVSAASVEGSVPALAGKITHYDGEVMAPWSASDASVPYVNEMLAFPHLDSWSKILPANW